MAIALVNVTSGNQKGEMWGDADYFTSVIVSCNYPDVSDRCYCVDSQATFYYDDDETYGSGTCFYYTAGDRLNTDDCSALLDKYPDSIHASYVCCLVLIFVSFVYSIFGNVNLII